MRLFIILILVLSSGCMVSPSREELQSLVGKRIDFAMRLYGAPEKFIPMGNDETIYTWEKCYIRPGVLDRFGHYLKWSLWSVKKRITRFERKTFSR